MTSVKFIILFFAVSLLVASTASQQVLLQHGKLCTLQVVGHVLDSYSRRWPVYRRVCRMVIPGALGDTIVDDEDEDIIENDDESKDDTTGELRRAILAKI